VGAGTAAGQSAPDCSQVSYNGDGTEQNPYEVGNVDQLQCIVDRETGTEFGDHFVQVSDIDATETENWNNGNGFGPIEVFHGSFDGNGYQITGLTIDRTDEYHVGLFRRFPLDPGGADIDDIHLVNVDIRGAGGGGAGVGALVGEADEFSVTNSSVAGTITGFGNNIGGMVGRSYSSTIAYSHADVDVTNADSEAFGTGGL
jgi:hypothetical protein